MNQFQERLAHLPVAEDESQSYVGPTWIREARKTLTANDIIDRAEAKRKKKQLRQQKIFGVVCNAVAVLVWLGIALWAVKVSVDLVDRYWPKG